MKTDGLIGRTVVLTDMWLAYGVEEGEPGTVRAVASTTEVRASEAIVATIEMRKSGKLITVPVSILRTWDGAAMKQASRKPVLYLCGGINGLSDADAKGWREQATAEMGDLFEVLDPMRRDYRGREGQFFTKTVIDDLIDVQRADVLLVRAETPSWGTAMEVAYAYRWSKRTVAFGVPNVEGASPWLRYHTQGLFPTLPDAMTYIRSLILKYGTVSASGSELISRNG